MPKFKGRTAGLGTRDQRLETREGAHYARVIYRSNNPKPEELPQDERVNEALLRVQYYAT